MLHAWYFIPALLHSHHAATKSGQCLKPKAQDPAVLPILLKSPNLGFLCVNQACDARTYGCCNADPTLLSVQNDRLSFRSNLLAEPETFRGLRTEKSLKMSTEPKPAFFASY